MNHTYRFLILGAGSIGKRHIRNLLALQAGEICAFDPRPDRCQEVEHELGIRAVADMDEAWALDPDVVFVTSPTSLHVVQATEAALRGCHLFIEKPLADTWQGVETLVQAVEERQLVTLVGCNMRFHPGLRFVKHLLESGAIGTVTAARVEAGHYLPDWHPWEDYRQTYSARRALGGGIILDAIHEIDYIRWMLGEVRTVACFADKLSHLEIDTEDTAAILLRFETGAIGEIHLDYVQRTYRKTCQIIGDEGTIHWSYVDANVRWFEAATKTWEQWEQSADWHPNQMYVDELKHFLACLQRQEQPLQDVSEGARALSIALEAKSSAANGIVKQL